MLPDGHIYGRLIAKQISHSSHTHTHTLSLSHTHTQHTCYACIHAFTRVIALDGLAVGVLLVNVESASGLSSTLIYVK